MAHPRATRLARTRPSRRGDEAPPPGPGGVGAQLEVTDCYLCGGEIEPMEPFQLALVMNADRRILNLPFHQACEFDHIATAVGDEVEAMSKGKEAASMGERLRDLVAEVLERFDEYQPD